MGIAWFLNGEKDPLSHLYPILMDFPDENTQAHAWHHDVRWAFVSRELLEGMQLRRKE